MQTKYRIVDSGYYKYLQYLTEYKFLWFKIARWRYVPYPYYHPIFADSDPFQIHSYVCTYNSNLKQFVEKYPDVGQWLAVAKKRQKEQEDAYVEKELERQSRVEKVEYL